MAMNLRASPQVANILKIGESTNLSSRILLH